MSAYPDGQDLTDALFHKIARYVYDQAGINLGENKRELVRARLGKVIRQRRMKGFRDYYAWMVEDTTGEAVEEVLNAISTNLTSFFREPQHFQYLQAKLLPRIVREREASGTRRIRAWSAGCSTGEEAYTIAITLLDNLDDPARWDVRILATDLDTNVLAHGRRGVYDKDRVKTISLPYLRRFFLRGEGRSQGKYKVRRELQALLQFRPLNLMHSWPFRGPFDFIFCRNVMIYFNRETQQTLINRFYDTLAPGGHLFIGHSEGLTGIAHRFKYVQPTVYEK